MNHKKKFGFNSKFAVLIIAMVVTLASCGDSTTPAALTIVTGNVMFGKTRTTSFSAAAPADTSGGTPCSGRGYCNLSASGCLGCTPASFYLKDTTPLMLIMTFSMTVLSANQPDQRNYFTDPSHTYQFETEYPLTNSLFTPLGLPANPVIKPTDKTSVRINGDQVTLAIAFSHS